MIKGFRILNYQSLQDIKIVLGDITCIVGETDSGKSAFVRAIKGLINNESGSSFVTHGKDFAKVSVILDEDNKIVSWSKGKKVNMYEYDGSVFDKVGTNCPPEVAKVLQIGDVELGQGYKFNPNVHSQFDIPFLLSDSGGFVSKVFGRVGNINLFILASREAKKRLRLKSNDLKYLEATLESKKNNLKDYDGLDDISVILKGISSKFLCYSSLNNNFNAAEALLEDIYIQRKNLSVLKQSLEKYKNTVAIISRIVDTEPLSKDIEAGEKFLEEFRSSETKFNDCKSRCGKLSTIFKILSRIKNSESTLSAINNLEEFKVSYKKISDERSKAIEEVNFCKKVVFNVEGEYKEFIRENPICPLCGGTLDAEDISCK